MKEEIVEDMSTFHSADDLLPQANHSTFYPPPVEVDDISEHNDEPFRDKKNVDFEVPFKVYQISTYGVILLTND